MKIAPFVVFFATMLAICPKSARAQKAPEIAWQNDNPPSPIYSSTYKLFRPSGVCYVNVLANGSGVMLIASLTSTQRKMMQQITVNKTGSISFPSSATPMLLVKSDNGFVRPMMAALVENGQIYPIHATKEFSMEGSYEYDPFVPDLFKKYCLAQAKELPPEVRHLFFGYDGIR